ncbi:uncharacterized protein BDZ99DRAFT_382976 [Mytilinidion resinicola]|uniref:Reticulon-like protein n=1 Tax=Mytilinidion resinicola TaxID=574789 RepID=A0A6A6YWL7_9PEZI|nr:uncharacterized protein BDZ99DRAFT_382976 [Mytilinidion resinicola]KAF2812297.1 hypothetical protein BDZ99DRAFT_382976 [Mytilinidion resinicola]
MSEAPHIELNTSDFPDLDPSAPSNLDSYSNGTSTTANGGNTVESTKNSVVDTARSAMDSVASHPATQQAKDTINNGPIAQSVKAEGTKTKNDLAGLANSRVTPEQPAATGQPLTHYHSLFYRLLSWKNPRATAIAFAASVLFIFAARYINILRYTFKGIYIVLGVSAATEIASKSVIGNGIVSQNLRPRKYFMIPKASLERALDDAEQFINFFVVEAQRIIFAENVYVTVGAFFSAFISYFLIKFVPLWGLSLITTSVAYLAPLVYIKNKDAINAQLQQASHIANQQAQQIKDLAATHTGNAAKTFQSYAGEYSHKAQSTINQYRGRSTSPEIVKKEDFPTAPKDTPIPTTEHTAPAPVAEPAF